MNTIFCRLGAARRARATIAHVSSAHVWTDNRVHLREAATTAQVHTTLLIAVESPTDVPPTNVTVIRLRKRARLRRVILNTGEAVALALVSGAEVIHLHDPELLWAVPLFRVLGRKVVFDAHEDLPDQFRNRHYLPRWTHGFTRLVAHGLVRLAGTCDHIIAATARTGRRYPPQKTTVVHNFPRLRAEEETLVPLSERPASAVYIGAVSTNRGSATMHAAALEPAFPAGWRLDVAGPSYPECLRDSFAPAEAAGKAVVHGLISPESARDLLLAARVGLVVLQPTDAYRNALATKMFEYLAAGIPVIASDFPLWMDLLEGHDCATFIPPDDPRALALAVARYAENPELLERHGVNARRAALEVFNWSTEEAALLGVYRTLGVQISPLEDRS